MKKTLALVLMLAAMLVCTTAFAGTIAPDAVIGSRDETSPVVSTDMTNGAIIVDHLNDEIPYTTLFNIEHNGADFDWDIWTFAEGTYTYEGGNAGVTENWDIATINATNSDGKANNGELTHWLVITYVNAAGEEVVEGYQFFADWTQYQHGWFGYTLQSFSALTLPCWYPNNTANAFGPKVNGSWQTYAVADLTVEGTQTFDMIAAGAWKIGTVSVTVTGDEVVVNYLMSEDVNTRDIWDDITVDSEYLNLFTSADEIDLTAESIYAFGQPVSIENDLAGAKAVIVMVSNKVDYPSHSPFVTRFWPNLWENKAAVEAMNALLVVEEEVPAE